MEPRLLVPQDVNEWLLDHKDRRLPGYPEQQVVVLAIGPENFPR